MCIVLLCLSTQRYRHLKLKGQQHRGSYARATLKAGVLRPAGHLHCAPQLPRAVNRFLTPCSTVCAAPSHVGQPLPTRDAATRVGCPPRGAAPHDRDGRCGAGRRCRLAAASHTATSQLPQLRRGPPLPVWRPPRPQCAEQCRHCCTQCCRPVAASQQAQAPGSQRGPHASSRAHLLGGDAPGHGAG